MVIDVFYENYRRLLSDNYYLDEKMGCPCSKSDETKIKTFSCSPPGDDFGYLRPHGTITLSIDKKYNIPIVDIRLDDWYENSARLWTKHKEHREDFLLLEKTPLQTLSVSSLSSDDSGIDTFNCIKKQNDTAKSTNSPT